MKRILITGINGFVGGYFVRHLRNTEPATEIFGVDVALTCVLDGVHYHQTDLTDYAKTRDFLAENQPDWIVHFAAVSSVAASWQSPVLSFLNNTNIFLNIVEGVRSLGLKSRILSVGSSEEYGNYPAEEMPLREDYRLNPCNPYAVARVSQEMLSRLYADSYGLDIVMTRSFNHVGPGQRNIFVVASFIDQIIDMIGSSDSCVLKTGNLEIVRDFLDVRDVVEAYRKLLTDGRRGEVYNVCSGSGYRLRDVVGKIAAELDVSLVCEEMSDRIRNSDNYIIVGDNTKLCKDLGWKPRHEFYGTLREMITWELNKREKETSGE